jgi:uroporphyrinogen decarboxylase
MTKRDVVRLALNHQRPPYVPWQFGFTVEAKQKLQEHYGKAELEVALDNHIVNLGAEILFADDIGNERVRDNFGVVWDRHVDKDIGIVENRVLPEPTLRGYELPDPTAPRYFADIPGKLAKFGDRFRCFQVGFSLWERAWTLRGMADLMMDFYDHPDFVRELLHTIADYNIAQVKVALTYDTDAVYFGDDWGQQHGLQMGPALWREFILPEVTRQYRVVREAGRYVIIHSCGDVDELFDDLIAAGLDCFNPFQPEVMDVDALMARYRGRLAFLGGLSTQRTLPYGSVDDVKQATRHLLDLGRDGGYILAPAHDVEGDVPLENMLAFIETAQGQEGFPQ